MNRIIGSVGRGNCVYARQSMVILKRRFRRAIIFSPWRLQLAPYMTRINSFSFIFMGNLKSKVYPIQLYTTLNDLKNKNNDGG